MPCQREAVADASRVIELAEAKPRVQERDVPTSIFGPQAIGYGWFVLGLWSDARRWTDLDGPLDAEQYRLVVHCGGVVLEPEAFHGGYVRDLG